MSTPTLLIALRDGALLQEVQKLSVLARFETIEALPTDDVWTGQCSASQIDVAIVQCDGFEAENCQQLMHHPTLRRTEFILVSNGELNAFVDQFTAHTACYHLRTPLDIPRLSDLLRDLHSELLSHLDTTAPRHKSELDQFGLLVGSSAPMHRLYRMIRKAARADAKVLVIGESGVGKELVANTLHLTGARAEGPFVAINCGALSPELVESELFGHVKGAFTGASKDRAGVFERARGGTLFLDEVTEMPLEMQVKLLRVLENNEFKPVGSDASKQADVQVIAASNRDPQEALENGHLRQDLYFRLSQFPIHVPPLRERGEDIIGLAKHFLLYRNNEEHTEKRISEGALSRLSQHHWPGNVRELKHVIERAYLLAENDILEEHIVLEDSALSASDPPIPGGVPLRELERAAIEKTLALNAGNKIATAEQLGISVKTLYNKLDKYKAPSQR